MFIEKENETLKMISFPIGSYQCNCTVIFHKETKKAIVIDPGNDLPILQRVLDHFGLTPIHLLHTHAHFDHIGQSDELRMKTGAKLCLHKGDQFLYDMLPMQGKFFGQTVGQPGPIDEHIEHENEYGTQIHQKDFIKAIHTPGHTPGSTSFYTEAFGTPLLLSGDTLFNQSIGRTDLPGGDGNLIIKSIKERLMNLPDETEVITGHGPTTNIKKEKTTNPFLC